MNANLITAIGAALGVFLAVWTMASNFDKRNSDRFDSLQKQRDNVRDTLQKQNADTRDLLRAEMREMRSEIRLEIKEAADRCIVRA